MSNNRIELLAPAGNAPAALAAFDAGADAVYAGLTKFNARDRSENFSKEVLSGVVEYAHSIGRKVYVTLNTIIKENELTEVAECLSELSIINPDALIVQDLGVLRMIREYFPNLNIHASTQMGIHNSPGLKFAAELGVSRVILERQVTFDELRIMGLNSPVELEIFIHGALCCSMSGQCLFSSWHGGSSGNRGKCKQPCRRRFYSDEGNGFFFSAQDLCLIDRLNEIREMNVVSLKIEGRLRQPDYVKNTVSAYRLMLDTPSDAPDYGKLLGEARAMLAQTCGRKWSHGFYTAESMNNLISHENLGASGLLCGKVSEVREHGFTFITSKKIHVGDRIRVQPKSGDEGTALTVTKMFINDQNVMKARQGERVFICCDKTMPFDGLVFKIGESTADYSKRVNALPMPRTQLDLRLTITRTALRVDFLNAPLPPWQREWALADAEKRAIDAEDIEKTFRASDSTVLAVGAIECHIDGKYFIPVSVLKPFRRDFWDYVKENLQVEDVLPSSAIGLEKFMQAYQKMQPAILAKAESSVTVALGSSTKVPFDRHAIRAASIYSMDKSVTEAILPEFCPEEKIDALCKTIEKTYERGIRRFRASGLFALELLKSYRDVIITAGDAFPLCNSLCAEELRRFNVSKILAHRELEAVAVKALAEHSPLPVELYRFGTPLLLITRAKIPVEGIFRDARGNEFVAKFDRFTGVTRVYPVKTVSVPGLPGLLDFYDLTNTSWENKNRSEFNFNSCLQ